MCRSIKTLRREAPAVTRDETSAAALQFVRKISGFNKPSKANQLVFDDAVRDIAAVADRLLAGLPPVLPKKVSASPDEA